MSGDLHDPRARGGVLSHAALGVLAWALPLAVAVVTTPLIVGGLGPDGYAAYAWAMAFAAGIAACGPARGVLHLVSRARRTEIRRSAIATGLWTALSLGLVAVGLVQVLAGPAASAMQFPASVATAAVRIAAAGAVPAAVLAVCVGALQGARRFGAVAALTSTFAMVSAIGSAWIATRGWGVVTMLTWQAIATLGAAGAGVLVLHRAVGPIWGWPAAVAARGVVRFGLATVTTQMVLAAWLIVERTLVGSHLGARMLTGYVVALLLWAHASAAIASGVQVVASLSPAQGRAPVDRLARVYPSATMMTAIAAVAFTAVVAALGVSTLTLWVGRDLASVVATLMLPLAVGLGLNGLGSTAWFANEAVGHPLRNVLWAATGLALNGIVLLWLAPGGHDAAAGIARLLAVAPAPLFILWTERASAGRLQAPWGKILLYVVPSGVVLYAALRAVSAVAATSWLALVGIAATAAMFYAAVIWRLPVLADDDRVAVRRWLSAFTSPDAWGAALR